MQPRHGIPGRSYGKQRAASFALASSMEARITREGDDQQMPAVAFITARGGRPGYSFSWPPRGHARLVRLRLSRGPPEALMPIRSALNILDPKRCQAVLLAERTRAIGVALLCTAAMGAKSSVFRCLVAHPENCTGV